MIIYGSKATQLAKHFTIEKCQHCGAQNTIEIYVFQKYAHVFWLPFVPIGKTGVSQCSHCKKTMKQKEMPSSLLASYQNIKQQLKTPLWTFAGLAILIALIGWGSFSAGQKDAENAKMINSPQAGDVYEIKTPENQYTLYKVVEIVGDSVFINMNQYESNKSNGLDDIRKKGALAYSDEIIPFSKSQLKTMLSRGNILEVERNKAK